MNLGLVGILGYNSLNVLSGYLNILTIADEGRPEMASGVLQLVQA